MLYYHKEIIPKQPNLFQNFYFKRTIRQYIHTFKISILRIYKFLIQIIKLIKWK